MPPQPTQAPELVWIENDQEQRVLWQSQAGLAPPARIEVIDDTTTADTAYRLACEGTALLWRGDYHNARQLLQAMTRRLERSHLPAKPSLRSQSLSQVERFHLHRQAQAQRARTLGRLLVPFAADHQLSLRRAPVVRAACLAVYGERDRPYVASLRELLGLLGAQQWREKGVPVEALGQHIHPHYGVFAPIRSEYVQLVAQASLPVGDLAFDIGTGTGVLAAVLAQRGMAQVVATELDPRALACASENVARLGLQQRVLVVAADLFPAGRAALVVCNPPWLPGKPSSSLEQAIYDPDSKMLRGFLAGLAAHLLQDGQGWLVLSDFAEHLGLRSRETLLGWIQAAGLQVLERLDAKPQHPKATDLSDPLHEARAAEVTSLWRLAAASS
ncbi:MAG: class I SAM-dependent methyltransferase [Myxococcales bacterium]|nr:class I SAM-dependent methyltransferase [Myxococcales bacterium]